MFCAKRLLFSQTLETHDGARPQRKSISKTVEVLLIS